MGRAAQRYVLHRDMRGMVWDLLLYVPTVGALLYIGASLWYSANHSWAYVLIFMACFFVLAGGNRILGTRLIMLPSSPETISVEKDQVTIGLHGGREVHLVKEIRYFSDYAGKSFGLTGLDQEGRKHQFIVHRGQLASPGEFRDLQARLSIYR